MPEQLQNVAFKVTWVYGEDGPWTTPCTPKGRLINILGEGKVWCSQPECLCHDLVDTDERLPEGTVPCYDCRAPLEFRFASGVYQQGKHAGEPIPMKQTGVGKLAFLTSREREMSEEDRVIIACFRIDGVGPYPELKGNAVWADDGSPYALRIPPDRLDEAPRFWDFHKTDKQTHWGTGLFRYIPDDEAEAMWGAVAALCDTTHLTGPHGEALRSVRSWSKPEGIPDLIARKQVDWSTFQDGSHIPQEFAVDFEQANGGRHLGLGESNPVVLRVADQGYRALLVNLDRSRGGVRTDTLQIRWDSNAEFRELLATVFMRSLVHIEQVRKAQAGASSRPNVVVPADLAEYIDFLRTDVPFTYRLELHPRADASSQSTQATANAAVEVALARGQGFRSDAATNRAIEKHAMRLAAEHFEGEGYVVEDVSANHPYDLGCTLGDDVLFVEVKGTQTRGQEILLTRNEVEFARRSRASMALFIVSGIELDADGKPTGGRVELTKPWDVDQGLLRPYGYTYQPHVRAELGDDGGEG